MITSSDESQTPFPVANICTVRTHTHAQLHYRLLNFLQYDMIHFILRISLASSYFSKDL